MKWGVLSSGNLGVDVLVKPVAGFPPRGGALLIDRMQLGSGGCALNTAVALARLGVRSGINGRVGADFFGDFLIRDLKKMGVDIRGVSRDSKHSTPGAIVLLSADGERTFLLHPGTNTAFSISDVPFRLLSDFRILFLSSYFIRSRLTGAPAAALLKKAKSMGLVTCVDPGPDPHGRWLGALEPCLPWVDIFLPSFEEASRMAGTQDAEQIAECFLKYKIPTIGIKLGSKGCFLATRTERLRIPGFGVTAVDTTGAGDCFVAGFLAAHLKGFTLRDTGRFANAVGALAVSRIGATAGVPRFSKVMEFIKRRGVKAPGKPNPGTQGA